MESTMIQPVQRAAAPMYRTILVPLDGSDLAAGAIATARALARRFDAAIHTIGVAAIDVEIDELRSHAAKALGVPVDDPSVHVVVGDDVAGAIRARAARLESCLVCLSTHGLGRVEGAMLGSVARDVLEQGHEPVVAVGPRVALGDHGPVPSPLLDVDHLVACVDGTPDSEGVIPVAAAWAAALRMRLTIVTVAEPSPPPLRSEAAWRRHHGPDMDADEYARRLAERWAQAAPGLRARAVYDPIGPADGMRDDLAREPAGLIAVASHLRTGLQRVVLGAAAADIVRVSSAPALVVPLTTAR
jgi:nucleotide-binding universal stress UspA family protein